MKYCGRKIAGLVAMMIVLTGYESISAQSKIDQIDTLVIRYYELGLLNGCILVADHGNIIYERALGYTDYRRNTELTLDHGFKLASLSAPFTAMAIMILHERGSLSLNDNVRKHLPELPYQYIRIRNLLTHTSGLPDYGAILDEYWDVDNKFKDRRRIVANEDALKLLIEHNPQTNFFPGQHFEYCDTEYMLLALIIERVSGMRFHDFLADNIFTPLKMDNSYVDEPTGMLNTARLAKGYRLNDLHTGFEPFEFHYQNGIYGNNGVVSTVHDLFKWDQSLDSDKLVNQSMMKQAFTPVMLNDSSFTDYGFGWSIKRTDRGRVVAHNGSWLGYRTYMLRDLEAQTTIVQLCNMPGIDDGDLASKIHDILNNRDFEMPKKSIADELMEIIHNSGINAAREKFRLILKEHTSEYRIDEKELIALGKRLVEMDKLPEAIEILRLCTMAHPNSVQGYNNLAQIYLLIDEGELAIDCLQKSLILNPENNLAEELLMDLNLEFDKAPLITVSFLVIPEVIVEGDEIYISGNHSNLGSWNPGAIQLYEEHNRTWTRKVKLNEGMLAEYKITRGNWNTEAIYNDQGSAPFKNFFKVKSDTTIEVKVANWKDLLGEY